jgi:hypothetical protein
VISRPATEAAFCKATRTTFAGSMMPISTRSPYSPVWALKPKVVVALLALDACRRRSNLRRPRFGDLTDRGLERLADDVDADACWSSLSPSDVSTLKAARSSATPPPGDDAFFNGSAGGVQRVVDAVLASPSLPLRWRRRP